MIAREPEQFSETRARVIISSVRVSAAYRALLADGFGLPPLLELGSPAAAARAATAGRAPVGVPNRSSTRMLVVGPIWSTAASTVGWRAVPRKEVRKLY